MGRRTLNRYLLDTHIFVPWIFRRFDSLSKDQKRILKKASAERPLLLSEISLWEVANLVSLGRIRLDVSFRPWIEAATAPPLVERLGITPAVADEVASLPATFHRDPADRIIVATARVYGAILLTADRQIIDSGIVRCVAP